MYTKLPPWSSTLPPTLFVLSAAFVSCEMSFTPSAGAVVLKEAVAAWTEPVTATTNTSPDASTSSRAAGNDFAWDAPKVGKTFFIGGGIIRGCFYLFGSVCFGGQSNSQMQINSALLDGPI